MTVDICALYLCAPALKRALSCLSLRYMMQWPGGRILQRHELDAFLAQAVSSQLYEPDQLQELKVRPHSSKSLIILFVIYVFSIFRDVKR